MALSFCSERNKDNSLRYLSVAISKGLVDEVMIPYLNRLNKLSGIFTSACCSGHSGEKEGYVVLGILNEETFNKLFVGSGTLVYPFNNHSVRASLDFAFGCKYFYCFDPKSDEDTTQIMERLCNDLEKRLDTGK